jgi:hypothetical protein
MPTGQGFQNTIRVNRYRGVAEEQPVHHAALGVALIDCLVAALE